MLIFLSCEKERFTEHVTEKSMIYGKLNVHNTSYFQEYLIPFNHIVFKSIAFSVYLYIFQRIHKDRKSDDGLKNCLRNNTQEKNLFYQISCFFADNNLFYFIH